MSPKPRKEVQRATERSSKRSRSVAVTPAEGPGWEPFARFPLSRLGPEWFGPNWLTNTDWFGPWSDLFSTQWPMTLPSGPNSETFRMEEYDDDEAHVIRADVPGLDPETDITIEVEHDILSVAVTRQQRTETSGESYHSEFSYGTFRRMIRLPAGSTADDVSASYEAGVLEIRIARQADERPVVSIPVRQS